MIVIAIILIAVSVATPNFNTYRHNTNLKEAARDISSDISLYRQRAVSENTHYRMTFNASGSDSNYTIEQENPAGSGTYVNLNTLEPAVPNPKSVGAGNANIVISGTAGFTAGTWIILNPRGTVTNCNPTCTVNLTHNVTLSTASININYMGRANVQYTLK